MQAQGGVEVFSIAQHLLKSLPAGVIIAGGHKELLDLLELVYPACVLVSCQPMQTLHQDRTLNCSEVSQLHEYCLISFGIDCLLCSMGLM